MSNQERLAEIRALALAATPGPWKYVENVHVPGSKSRHCTVGVRVRTAFPENTHAGNYEDLYSYGSPTHKKHYYRAPVPVWFLYRDGDKYFSSANMAYIAAVDPQTVLGLIAQIEEMEKELREGCN